MDMSLNRIFVITFVFMLCLASLIYLRVYVFPHELKIYEHNVEKKEIAHLKKLIEKNNAENLAQIDFRRGDYRFVGYNGVVVITPGVPLAKRRIYGFKVIAGSSDYVRTDLSQDYMESVRKFALEYNKAKLKLLIGGE